MNDITEVDRLNAEIADLKRTIKWYQGRTGIMMGAAALAEIAAQPAPISGAPTEPVHQWRRRIEGQPWFDASQEIAYQRVDENYEARTLFAVSGAVVARPGLIVRLVDRDTPPDNRNEVIDHDIRGNPITRGDVAAFVPQAPDATAAPPEIDEDDEDPFEVYGRKAKLKREDWDPATRKPKIVAATLPAAPAPIEQAPGDMPTLPQHLLDVIGEYGCARSDDMGEMEILHRWETLIGAIKNYARAALAARQAPTAAALGGDSIAKSKHILNLVDDYAQRPTSANRTMLRMALMDEFDGAVARDAWKWPEFKDWLASPIDPPLSPYEYHEMAFNAGRAQEKAQ